MSQCMMKSNVLSLDFFHGRIVNKNLNFFKEDAVCMEGVWSSPSLREYSGIDALKEML